MTKLPIVLCVGLVLWGVIRRERPARQRLSLSGDSTILPILPLNPTAVASLQNITLHYIIYTTKTLHEQKVCK